MKHSYRWIVVILILTALMLSACGQPEEAATKPQPALVEPIEGTEFNRVTLTERAAERLGIETTQVHEQLITRERTVGGQVEALPGAEANASLLRVRVPLNVSDVEGLVPHQAALILPLDDDDDDEELGLTGEAIEADDLDDTEPDDLDDLDEDAILYYQVDNTDQRLTAGQRVRVRLSMAGSGEQRMVVPYAAVIYDLQGATWVYVSPEPLVFVREAITIDFIQGDLAILSAGPAVGTEVATVGVAELYGTDTGVGK